MYALRSQQISKRLYWAMSIIILCLLCICVPLIVSSIQSYTQTLRSSQELQALREVAVLAHKISRERGPANKLMSSAPEDSQEEHQVLNDFRNNVDAQMEHTAKVLNQLGFSDLSQQVNTQVRHSLDLGRAEVDAYVNLPMSQRTAMHLDQAILKMFSAWDASREILKAIVSASDASSASLSPFITQILLLADLRDEARRVASNIMAPVTFNEPISAANLGRLLQTQKQVDYLLGMIDTTQPAMAQTLEFKRLHARIQTEFIQKGMPVVSRLMQESIEKKPYFLTGVGLTDVMVDKFVTVVDLQTYMLQLTEQVAEQEMARTLRYLLWTCGLSVISLLVAFSTMIFARKRIIEPLIEARNTLLDLSHASERNTGYSATRLDDDHDSLFVAIEKLQRVMQQRDAFEFRLKNIAHSDSLTGLSNRFALEEYIRFLEKHPEQFAKICLMVIDIDHFKQVNDSYGHIVGDEVICAVADSLQYNVRTSDLVVRYGGDEFLILIEDIEKENALNVGQKICDEIAIMHIPLRDGQGLHVSVSIGIAVGAHSWIELFEKADQALFSAKAKGRNTISW